MLLATESSSCLSPSTSEYDSFPHARHVFLTNLAALSHPVILLPILSRDDIFESLFLQSLYKKNVLRSFILSPKHWTVFHPGSPKTRHLTNTSHLERSRSSPTAGTIATLVAVAAFSLIQNATSLFSGHGAVVCTGLFYLNCHFAIIQFWHEHIQTYPAR